MTQLTASRLRELLNYDSETGEFRWRVKPRNNRIKEGDVAGTTSHGYRHINVDGRIYRAHRLAWLYTYGEWPKHCLDHINLLRSDNRIANLREATRSENNRNTGVRSHNLSGRKGVSWSKGAQKYFARIRVDGVQHYLGLFESADDAARAYATAALDLHGEFARTAR